jgi:solute carrier family 25 phosphate transporter 23/24/25/41
LEMIQRRIQVAGMKQGTKLAYKNMFQGIYIVGKNEGIGALYAGLLPNYAKILPSAAISFYVYELMKQIFEIN